MARTRKPSSRTHRLRPLDGLNLTPFIDMITCLMFFLLLFAAVVPVAIIDAPLPKIASTAEEIQKAKADENKLDLIVYIDSKGLRVRASGFREQVMPLANGKYPYAALHNALVTIHQKRPNSKEITLLPSDEITYETIIAVMDSARELVRGDTGYQVLPPDVQRTQPSAQQFNQLFPEVSIGGV